MQRDDSASVITEERASAGGMLRRALWITGVTGMVVLGVFCFARTALRDHLKALAILEVMNGAPEPWIVQPVLNPEVTVQQITLPGAGMRARLYTPLGEVNPPGVVLLHGLHYQGMDTGQLRRYAAAMASCGMLVLTPDLPQLREYQSDTSSIDQISQSVRWLSAKTGRPVGLIGTSFSGALALMAAARPEIASSVRFVFTAGTYDDMARLATFYATGHERTPDGAEITVEPFESGRQALAYWYTSYTASPQDRTALRAVLLAQLSGDKRAALARMAALTPDQKAELDQLLTPHTAEEALAGNRSRMDSISPHGHLAGLRAPVLLLHGEGDRVVPSAEASWLAQDLPPGVLKIELITPLVTHIALGSHAHPWSERWALVHFFAQVVHAAGV
jgi:pimeloyl-ACP methyl ester carboxylesterase